MTLQVVDRLTDAHVEELCALYREEWWTKGREPSSVRRMLEHTDLVLGVCREGAGRLLAFARVLTDRVWKALGLDVIVARSERGTGLGRFLLDRIVEHPLLARVRDLELYCRPELVSLHARWGFTADLGELRFMRLTRAGVR
ncbi:GNAT family N-acetyltransferase [bacterium]|nr:GNAT family N-acetyltransferase [bacterium]